ncbi:hypothetical protein [Candidatus Palauibacter sp.]|uniref:hypothetical protein n=1 Tax=Candidatus Palauibacter sp. TaxID=3101350 RepID=UPI003C6F8E4A
MGLNPEMEWTAGSIAARGAVPLLLAALASGAGPGGGAAQSRPEGYGALVLEAPASVEAAAYGNAPYLFGGGSDLLFYAPALIARADGMASGLQRYGSEGTLATLAGKGAVGLGDFAVGLQYLRYSGRGIAPGPDLQGAAATPDGSPVTEFAASLGYARELFGVFGAGIVAKYLELQFARGLDRAVVLDVGVAREFGPTMVSLAARNLGSDLELHGRGVRIPTQLALGVSTERFEVGELDMFLTSQLLRRRDGEIIPAGGVELSYWPVQGYTFRLRAGLQRVVEDERSPFTFGFAFTGDALTVEYAFQAFDVDGDAHRLGLSFR